MRRSRLIDGKRFVWRGEEYPSLYAARNDEINYNIDGFFTRLIREGHRYRLYVRSAVPRSLANSPAVFG